MLDQFVLNSAWLRSCGFLCVVWLSLFSSTVTAQPSVYPVDKQNVALNELHQSLVQALKQKSFKQLNRQPPLITIGAAAFRHARAADPARPIVAAFITTTQFERSFEPHNRPDHVTAVFSNPDPIAQLALTKALMGRPGVGVFQTAVSRHLVARLTDVAGASVRPIPAQPGQHVNTLIRNLALVDALIVLPDGKVINRTNIGHVVRSLYQQRKVLIGYSDTLTRIGALASIFPRRDAINTAVVEAVDKYYKTGSMVKPSYVRDLDFSVNERLAKSLNIAIPDRKTLIDKIKTQEAALIE